MQLEQGDKAKINIGLVDINSQSPSTVAVRAASFKVTAGVEQLTCVIKVFVGEQIISNRVQCPRSVTFSP